MKTIDTLGTVLTYNFGIIILFFTWFLVDHTGLQPRSSRSRVRPQPTHHSAAPAHQAGPLLTRASSRWTGRRWRSVWCGQPHDHQRLSRVLGLPHPSASVDAHGAHLPQLRPGEARQRRRGCVMRERAAAHEGSLRTPSLPAPYSLLTPSVAARRAAVGRGALGWVGLGWELRLGV